VLKLFILLGAFSGEPRTAGNSRDTTENTRKLEAIFWSGIFGIFSTGFRQILVLSDRIRPEIIEKILENSWREYCFHVPDISSVFLQDPVTFPHPSCKIRWQERSTWVYVNLMCINLFKLK
jgi:hypothetical protein